MPSKTHGEDPFGWIKYFGSLWKSTHKSLYLYFILQDATVDIKYRKLLNPPNDMAN